MAYEIGGRSDKFGNRYENRWVAKQLLKLCHEQISSLIHEPVGEIEEGIDLITHKKDNIVELHQCKGSNANKDSWSISDLNSRGIFMRIKKHLELNVNHFYKFVTPLSCQSMQTLISRAENSSDNPMDFYNYQIKAIPNKNAPDIENNFKLFLNNMDLSEDENGYRLAKNYLSRIEFVLFPDSKSSQEDIIDRISDTFSADSETVYNLLLNYIGENNRFGHNISTLEINNYLESKNIYRYDLTNNSQILPRIQTLNETFKSSFVSLNSGLVGRNETEQVYSYILEGKSVVIHGKAGSGKSGVVQELIQKLKENEILYLALKLDKYIPETSARVYGENILDLTKSPVLCLSQLEPNKNSVLILDQLDAIRWTTQNTRTALDVCKELIKQVNRNNSDDSNQSKVSVIFVCRTFDVENDSGIKLLFDNEEEHNQNMQWERIVINDLDDEVVKAIVGGCYEAFNAKFKELLRNINNLYIWSKLDTERKSTQYASAYHLIRAFWEQFEKKCEKSGINHTDVCKLKTTIIDKMSLSSRTSIPKSMMNICSPQTRELAISEGIIIEIDILVFFVHQSFFDVFVVETMVEKVYTGTSIDLLLGSVDMQTPQIRYQLQMLLQNLAEIDQSKLVECCKILLQSDNVRFYMKYVVWEVIGQIKAEQPILDFIEKNMTNWLDAITNTVMLSHPYYIEHFIRNGYISSLFKSDKDFIAINLLRSVSEHIGDAVADFIEPYILKDENIDTKIYGALCWDMEKDSDKLFDIRLKLLATNPEIKKHNYFHFKKMAKNDLMRAARLLETIIESSDEAFEDNIGSYIDSDFNVFKQLSNEFPEYLWEKFMPIFEKKNYCEDYSWRCHDRANLGREIVNMIIVAGEVLAERHQEKYIKYFRTYCNSTSLIVNEVLLYSSIMLSSNFADDVIKWLISDSCSHMSDETGKHDTKLTAAKKLIEKYSKVCSDEIFSDLEVSISKFREPSELEIAEYRFEHNKAVRNGNSQTGFGEIYLAYWGELQAFLLPALDETRTSKITKQLIRVLERRFKGHELGGIKPKISSDWVNASISQEVSMKFSDNYWLKLINNKKLCNKEFLIKSQRRWGSSESSHFAFSRLYENAGNINPERFVVLAQKFPLTVDRHYIQAVWSIASKDEPPKEIENWNPATFESISQTVNFALVHPEKDELNMCMEFCRLIRNRADCDWSDEIIERVIYLALNYEEKDRESDDLEITYLNTVRGSAVCALSSLLWGKYDRYDMLKSAIEELIIDENPAIRLAILEAVIATYNIKKEQSVEWFFALVKSDERIASHRRAIYLIFKLWADNKDECNSIITNLFYSENEKCSRNGAFLACNLYIVCDDVDIFKDMIFNGKLSCEQVEGCTKVAVDLMDKLRLRDKSKSVIEEMLKYPKESKKHLSRLFYHSKFNPAEDIELIKKIISLNPNESFLAFEHYIEKNDVPIEFVTEIVFHLCEQFVDNRKNIEDMRKGGYYSIVSELPKLITRIYDRATNNDEVRENCLNIWDILYRSDIANARILTQQIMDY